MLKERLKYEKLTAKQIIELEGQIQESQEQIGNNLAGTFNEVAGVLSEASSLFKKFGDDDLGQLLDQLSGVASGAASIASGIASKNPLQVLQGGYKYSTQH